jgi:hypothetical protein
LRSLNLLHDSDERYELLPACTDTSMIASWSRSSRRAGNYQQAARRNTHGGSGAAIRLVATKRVACLSPTR